MDFLLYKPYTVKAYEEKCPFIILIVYDKYLNLFHTQIKGDLQYHDYNITTYIIASGSIPISGPGYFGPLLGIFLLLASFVASASLHNPF